MTAKETTHKIHSVVTEISAKLRKCKTENAKNRIIREICNKNDVNEAHIRKIGGYDR
jgi:hypothetical protein